MMSQIRGVFSLLVLASCAAYCMMLPLAAAFRPSGSSSPLISVPSSPLTPTNDLYSSSSSSRGRTTSTILFMGKSGNKKKKKSSGGPPVSSSKGFAGMGAIATDDSVDRFPYAGSVRPGTQSPQRRIIVSASDVVPDYALDGRPKKGSNSPLLPWVIEVKKPDEIEKMRESGKLARHILDLAGRAVKPGIATDEIDTIVHEAIIEAGAYPCT